MEQKQLLIILDQLKRLLYKTTSKTDTNSLYRAIEHINSVSTGQVSLAHAAGNGGSGIVLIAYPT